MDGLQVWTMGASFGLLALTAGSIVIAGLRLSRPRPPFLTDPRSVPVTVVRPLRGLEPFSEETLRAGFRLDHPAYELVCCVASSADPVIPLVRRMMAEHPDVACRLLVGEDRVSRNPKLNNCVKGWDAAEHDWVILADSNVLMPPDYVARMLRAWRPDTGLVCSTPLGTRPASLWAEVECAFLNTLQARWQYASEAVGLGFAQGKSMLWFRPFLEARGGIRALASDIAEDAASTKLVRASGLRVHLVDRPFDQPLGSRRLGDVWARQLRWARLRRVTFPLFFAPEILSGPALAVAALLGVAPHPAAAAAVLLALWYGAEIALARLAGWPIRWRTPLAFAIRDLMLPIVWVAAFATREVVWHGQALRIGSRDADDVVDAPARA